jgi:1-acyl-sn-glycerol-3-phosphate acyltransferase
MTPASQTGAPTDSFQQFRRLLAFLVRIFFRRVEVVGLENIPPERGGVLVAWHPNGLIDPALILSSFPRHVVFGARHGLFRVPVLGHFMRAIGTVPIYRRQDVKGQGGDGPSRNDASLELLTQRIADGAFTALFPEGVTHDAPFLRELKTGAARVYYSARTLTPAGRPAPVVIPVGLHYDHKRVFRSTALVVFHPPLALPPELDVTPAADADPEEVRGLARRLTEHLERALGAVVLETESWEDHRLLHRARKLIRAERARRAAANPGQATLDERVLGLARVWLGYRHLATHRPAELAALRRRLERYDGYLRSLGMEDHELDQPPPIQGPGDWLLAVLRALAVYVLLLPLVVIGYAVNLPPALLLSGIASTVGGRQSVASIKLGGGIVLFPLTWALWGWLAARGSLGFLPWLPAAPALAGGAMVLLSVGGAVVMLAYVGWALSTLRALRVRLTRDQRARALQRLRKERARLCDDLIALGVGLALPGVVEPDGRIARMATG